MDNETRTRIRADIQAAEFAAREVGPDDIAHCVKVLCWDAVHALTWAHWVEAPAMRARIAQAQKDMAGVLTLTRHMSNKSRNAAVRAYVALEEFLEAPEDRVCGCEGKHENG